MFEAEGAEFELNDELKTIPPYDEDDDVDGGPEPVARLRDLVSGADAVFFATPEYNASVPGQLKNAVDWLSRPVATSVLRGKPALVIGASTGAFGAVWAQAELRKVLATAGARVVEAEVAVGHAPAKFDEDGSLIDEELNEQLVEALEVLVAESPVRPVALAV